VFDVMLLATDLGVDGLSDAEHKVLRDCYDALLHWDDAESKDKREESLWPIVNSQFAENNDSALYALPPCVLRGGSKQHGRSSQAVKQMADIIGRMERQASTD